MALKKKKNLVLVFVATAFGYSQAKSIILFCFLKKIY